jgi:CDP-glucose 4,6-dehydratase
VEALAVTPGFWRGRRVLLTGHTGFKGAWLALWLESLGAEVTAVALPPASEPNLFEALAPWPRAVSVIGDLRDPEVARAAANRAEPEIVFHLAAQALVRPSYGDPVGTFASNVLGTAHLLEALRQTPSVKAVAVVTSDKVYANDDLGRPFQEGDPLGGKDPYSASKACQEMVAASYRRSFFDPAATRIATARAGNVIGGGDWATDRLIPDFVRAMAAGREVAIRHPEATRPWQHVLEPLAGYIAYAERLHAGAEVPPALNFGPAADDVRPVRWVVERMTGLWGDGAAWRQDKAETVPEAHLLTLDAGLAIRSLGWQPRLALEPALDWTVAWYKSHGEGRDMRAYSLEQIERYRELGQ